VTLTGAVDRQIDVDGLTPRPWRFASPVWAVNLHGRGPQSHRLLTATRPGRLLGYACPAAGHHDGPSWIEDEHEAARWCRLLHWYGLRADPADLSLPRPSPRGMPERATVVHVGAKAAERRGPAHRFAEVARELAAAGHQVVVTGSAPEAALAAEVVRRAGLPGTAILAGRTDLIGLAALVGYARLVVTADTGVGHLATAYRVPSVVLFGPVPPSRWGPPSGRPWHRALWHPEVAAPVDDGGARGGAAPHPALAAVTVGEVLAAVAEVEHATAMQ
jgi:ADP-heptose:LPS heptosyltransferase